MPNWKSYESTVRLLSAIIAAHPGLKLNYDETAKFFGGGANYKVIWYGMNRINRHAKSLRDAVEMGVDPITVELNDVAQGNKTKGKGKKRDDDFLCVCNINTCFPDHPLGYVDVFLDIATRFGGDCTKSALENRFRRIKADAKVINTSIARGIDPITLNIGDCFEIAKAFGSDCTVAGLRFQMQTHIKPIVKLQVDFMKGGQDPKDIDLGGSKRSGDNDIAAHFGSDCTKGGLEWQFRRFKAGAKLQAAAVKAGVDPKGINVDVNPKGEPDVKGRSAIAGHCDDGTTAVALEHRFRPIKKVAAEMRAAVADKFGEGITGKAVSMRFERIRKEPQWNLNNTEVENASALKAGPRKRSTASAKSTPKKAASGNGAGYGNGGAGETDDDLASSFDQTPMKRSVALNKTKGGRISKAQINGRGRNGADTSAYVVDDDDDFDLVKPKVNGSDDIAQSFEQEGLIAQESWAWAQQGFSEGGDEDVDEDEDEEDDGSDGGYQPQAESRYFESMEDDIDEA